MANEQNLIPFSERTESEQREIRSKGGRVSGKKRRENKNLFECFDVLLKMPVPASQKTTKAILKSMGIKDKEQINAMAIAVSMLAQASKGSVPAARLIMDISKTMMATQKEEEEKGKIDGEYSLADMIEEAYEMRVEDNDAEQ